MICQFCHQDVQAPCHNAHEMQERALDHVERCERALKDNLNDKINLSYGQSAGSI